MSNRSTTPRQLPDIANHCGDPQDHDYRNHVSEAARRLEVASALAESAGETSIPTAGARRDLVADSIERQLPENQNRGGS